MAEVVFTFETFLTILITLLIITLNCLMLMVACWTHSFRNVNRCFLFSMIASDLFMGIFVTPFSIFNSLYNKWIFNSNAFCYIEGYLTAIFLISGLYSLTWMNVDHYVAIRKPERYKIVMSAPRSACWVTFAWIAAICFSCPPLFSLKKARYYAEAFICVIDAKPQRFYFLTAGSLVTIPCVLTLVFTNVYLFTKSYKNRLNIYQRVFTDRATRPWNYHISMVVSVVYTVTWTPFCVLRLYEISHNYQVSTPPLLHFYFLWLGISNSFLKFFIYLTMSQEFRDGLYEVFNAGSLDCSCSGCASSNSNVNVNYITNSKMDHVKSKQPLHSV